jgi:uncharacterized protein (TIGR02145 family)
MKNLFPIIAFLFLILVCCCKKEDGIKTGRSTAVFNSTKTYGTVKDIDGNVYKTITLGTQTWMAENLRTTCYQNGDPIPNVKGVSDPSLWGNLTTGAYCSYKNTSDNDSIATFGFLYNGYAVTDSRNIAPEGWHVATDAEWDTLETFVAEGEAETTSTGNGVAGGRLKEAGDLHWGYANHADNRSGFTAMPGGQRSVENTGFEIISPFKYITYFGCYWSSTSVYANYLLTRLMVPDFVGISRGQLYMSFGNSIRCIKD